MPESDSERPTEVEGRRETPTGTRPTIAGVAVREEDIESVRAIRFIARLFRGMAGLLVLLAIVQTVSGITGAVAISYGILFAESVRLLIFAGLLWGVGDLAVLAIKTHYDLRATRILVARTEYMMRAQNLANGMKEGTRADRRT